jgi:hypothetical protein
MPARWSSLERNPTIPDVRRWARYRPSPFTHQRRSATERCNYSELQRPSPSHESQKRRKYITCSKCRWICSVRDMIELYRSSHIPLTIRNLRSHCIHYASSCDSMSCFRPCHTVSPHAYLVRRQAQGIEWAYTFEAAPLCAALNARQSSLYLVGEAPIRAVKAPAPAKTSHWQLVCFGRLSTCWR